MKFTIGVLLIIIFLMGILIVDNDNKKVSTEVAKNIGVEGAKAGIEATGTYTITKNSVGCRSQNDFLKIVSNFSRYDQASAGRRMRNMIERGFCTLFMPGEVIQIREIDKLLNTVYVYRESENRSYYSSLVHLELAQGNTYQWSGSTWEPK